MSKIYVKDGQRINIRNYHSPDGVYSDITLTQFPQKMTEYGIQTLDEPLPPDDYSSATYRVERTDTAPFIQYIKKTQDELNAEHNRAIDDQIAILEKQQLLPRVVRDMMRMVTLKEAANSGLTEANLLDPNHSAYAPGYARFKAFDDQISALRAQRL